MLSAIKRLAGKTENGIVPGTSPGHQTMSQNLQRKFAKGVQYNMKIIIKGDRNTGKSCLFNRLQGKKFVEEYTQTEEIQVASIQWNYKAADDVVKVEVWDVVDKGKKRIPIEGLKLGGAAALGVVPEQAPALDAEFLDVFKGTNGVILTMDITKTWTFDYVQRELPKIPEHIPVLVLGNHCDMAHHRTVTADHVLYFIESIQRPKGGAQIRYTESSMSNGFGLKYIHKFFCLPFLQLQRETLLGLLERNKTEAEITVHELDIYQESEDADYDRFLDQLTSKRRQMAESHGQAALVQSQSSHSFGAHAQNSSATHAQNSLAQGGQLSSSDLAAKARSLSMPDVKPVTVTSSPAVKPVSVTSSSNPSTPQPPTPRPTTNPLPLASNGQPIVEPVAANGIMAKFFGKKDGGDDRTGHPAALVLDGVLDMSVKSVEEFVPDGGELDNSFLEENHQSQLSSNAASALKNADAVDSDSDTETTGNPLVTGFQDDLDPDEISVTEHIRPVPATSVRPPTINEPEKEAKSSEVKSDKDEELEEMKISEDVLDDWMTRRVSPTGRVSPEGGEDSAPQGIEVTKMLSTGNEKNGDRDKSSSRSKQHKKKSSKEKSSDKDKQRSEKSSKEERRSKKKKASSKSSNHSGSGEGHDQLEDFLNSNNNGYEVF
ncbi:rab-like protein 6 isoform X2 [Nilaparvata lugens]|uniref:rab-like protein 6 isoform X1 n=1 Tax=Nilaparvata lugens TaxID=108931 RepID=UPI00193D5BF4|nr:rab-like protein 6 isoform X1 [Nilaparvata lugens]XP_039289127.1 rab-like protein 6 isoform X2 [Nilaparvata lugens]